MAPGAALFPGHDKQVNLRDLSFGDPATSSGIGDRRGPYFGHTAAGPRVPWCHDSFWATERKPRRTNLHAAIGVPGAGKSVLGSRVITANVERGIETVVTDPSSMLGKLCTLPNFAPHAQAIDVVADGEPGLLNPPGLIADPTLEQCDNDPVLFARRMAVAEATRRDLVIDRAHACMPAYLFGRDATQEVIGAAAQRVTWARTSTMWDLVDRLEGMADQHATRVARALRQVSTGGKLALLFPERGEATDRDGLPRKTLTVFGSRGLHLPEDMLPREQWDANQHAASVLVPMMVLLTSRRAYQKPREQRIVLLNDEVHEPMKTAVGRALANQLARDSSKDNIAFYQFSQELADILAAGTLPYLASLTIGRLKTPEAAREALGKMNVDDEGLVDLVPRLPAGEFVHCDIDGQAAHVRCDVDYWPALPDYVFTDPQPQGSQAWDQMEELR
jgi:hypothetical protein